MSSQRVRVKYATIFLFPPPAKGKPPVVSTSPERLTVREGDTVDWTVVDASGQGAQLNVTIGWAGRSPLKREPEPFDRSVRVSVKKVKPAVYKYNVLIDGKVVFDPELEVVS